MSDFPDENSFEQFNTPSPSFSNLSLSPRSPSQQLSPLAGRSPSYRGRRLSRAQEMAMLDRKGERRVSPGLRVESGCLMRLENDSQETSTAPKGLGLDLGEPAKNTGKRLQRKHSSSRTTNESVLEAQIVEDRVSKDGKENQNSIENEVKVAICDQKPVDTAVEHQSPVIIVPGVDHSEYHDDKANMSPCIGDMENGSPDSLLKPNNTFSLFQVKDSGLTNGSITTHDDLSTEDTSIVKNIPLPASSGPSESPELEPSDSEVLTDKRDVDNQMKATVPEFGMSSIHSLPAGLSSTVDSTTGLSEQAATLPRISKHKRGKSDVLASLKKRYVTSVHSAWVPVGSGSILPQRQVVYQHTEQVSLIDVPDLYRQDMTQTLSADLDGLWFETSSSKSKTSSNVQTSTITKPIRPGYKRNMDWARSLPTPPPRLEPVWRFDHQLTPPKPAKVEEVSAGWDSGNDFNADVAQKSWDGWDEEQWEPEYHPQDALEDLANIADQNAKAIEKDYVIDIPYVDTWNLEDEYAEEQSENTPTTTSWGTGHGAQGDQISDSDWTENSNNEASIEGLAVSLSNMPGPITYAGTAAAEQSKVVASADNNENQANVTPPIDFRHIVQMVGNTLAQARPEMIVWHPIIQRVIENAQVDRHAAMISILTEVQQGPLHEGHYTKDEICQWYSFTFQGKSCEPDTIQALILGLIQVAAEYPLHKSEKSTMDYLRGDTTTLCALPYGHCHHHDPIVLPSDISMESVSLDTMQLGDDDYEDASLTASDDLTLLTPPTRSGELLPVHSSFKGKERAQEEVPLDLCDIIDTPPRPSSALPISDTQYSIFPRLMGMMSRTLKVTSEMVMLQPEMENALAVAGVSGELYQDFMFRAQELDWVEMKKPWQERQFAPSRNRWRAYQYFDAMEAIYPFDGADTVSDLPDYMRALIYIMMAVTNWPSKEPEEFIHRLQTERHHIFEHEPYKPPSPLSTTGTYSLHKSTSSKDPIRSPSITTRRSPITEADWAERDRILQLQIGSSTQEWPNDNNNIH